MRRFIMGLSILLFLGIAAAMALSFLFNAIEVMYQASKEDPVLYARFKNNPIEDLGYAGAALIASCGVLLVCLKYVLRKADDDSGGDDGENGKLDDDAARMEEWKRTHRVKKADPPKRTDPF